MKKNILNRFIIVLISLTFLGCKAKKGVISSTSKTDNLKVDTKEDVKDIVTKQSQFETFSTKSDTHINLDGKEYDANLNIRIKHGETIWISVTAAGVLEVARVMITPDSLLIMDRLNNQYLKKPFEYIYKFTSDQINYESVESILVGNCIPFILNEGYKLSIVNQSLNLKGRKKSLDYNITFASNFKPILTTLTNTSANQTLNMIASTFIEANKQLFPTKLNIDSKAEGKTFKANMNYDKIELNQPMEFPFKVPKRFSVIE